MDITREKMVISETMRDFGCFFIAFSRMPGFYKAQGRRSQVRPRRNRTACAMGQRVRESPILLSFQFEFLRGGTSREVNLKDRSVVLTEDRRSKGRG